MAHIDDAPGAVQDHRALTKRRLEAAAWGLLLVWSGLLLLMPGELGSLWDVWLVGVGALVLGAALVAVRLGSRPDADTWIVGIVALVSGLAGLFGVSISVVGLGLLAFGLAMIVGVVRTSIGHRLQPRDASAAIRRA